VVLASANHFLLDSAAGLAIIALGLLATRAAPQPDTAEPTGHIPVPSGAATGTPQPVTWWRRLARRWAWAVTGAAAVLIALRVPAVSADVRAALAHELRLPWLGAAVAGEIVFVAGLVVAQRQLLAGGVASTVAALAMLAASAAAASG
jgi:hypothetical protein